MVYGYNGDVASIGDYASKDKIHNHAENLIAELHADRRRLEATERPIVFVAHSLGSIVVKRALIYSSRVTGVFTEHLRSISVSTYGILFLGTPHLGSDVGRWCSYLKHFCNDQSSDASNYSQSLLVDTLKTNSETLQVIDRDFIHLTHLFRIFFFHEGRPMELKGVSQYIVDEESAAPNIQDVERGCIQEDHVHMCQFEDESTPGFSLVSEGIQRYASEAPEIIQRRWVKEKDSQRSRREAEIEKLLGGPSQGILRNRSGKPEDGATSKRSATRVAPFKVNTTLASRRDGYYIVPRQRVKDFIGRETQLQEITSRFSQESTQQPKVVILHALGGQGKSQIALEYCQRSRKEYRGIFWINASSEALALQSYSQIIRVLHGTSKGFVGDEDSLIDKVKDVLECWSEQWLLVFDNYDDSKKFPRVQKFLPNSMYHLYLDDLIRRRFYFIVVSPI